MTTGKHLIQWAWAQVNVLAGQRRKAVRAIMESGGITVLMFHNTRGKPLRALIRWAAAAGVPFLHTDDVLDWVDGKTDSLPTPAIWLTFDDGWKDNTTEVFPVLVGCDVPATVFLATKAVETGYFWFDVTKHPANQRIAPAGRYEYSRKPNAVREKLIAELLAHRDVVIPRNSMSVDDVRRWAQYPQITFENHSHDHVSASMCSPGELAREITTANHKIEQWTGRRPRIFCYPLGRFEAWQVDVLDECGMALALTTAQDLWVPDRTPEALYTIPRHHMPDDAPCAAFVNIALQTENCALVRRLKRLRPGATR